MRFTYPLLISLVAWLLATSCYRENQPKVDRPEQLLSEKEMIAVLTDIYVAESAISYHRMNKTLTDEISTRYYQQVFDNYQITHRILKENLRYYNATPEEMENIMEEVLANLSKLQSEVMAMEGAVNDSVQGLLQDTLSSPFTPSLMYKEQWSFASLIDSLLSVPDNAFSDTPNDSIDSE